MKKTVGSTRIRMKQEEEEEKEGEKVDEEYRGITGITGMKQRSKRWRRG